jgi:hypothetical protein
LHALAESDGFTICTPTVKNVPGLAHATLQNFVDVDV